MCLKRKRRHWLGRLAAEYHRCDAARFVTLTYDDELANQGKSKKTNCETGLYLPTEHMKQYFRQRRKLYKLRHFTVGEYGDKTGRPHWHSLQFYYGAIPDDVLDFSTHCYGWTRGNSQYELPKSIAASASYVYDYIDKGGKALKPSPGMGLQYLLNFAEMQARHRRRLATDFGIKYHVPGARKPGGGNWFYYIASGHHYAPILAEHYLSTWERHHKDQPDYSQFRKVEYDVPTPEEETASPSQQAEVKDFFDSFDNSSVYFDHTSI